MVDTACNAQQDGHVDRIAILGAGAWGTALAHHLGSHGTPVSLWARRAEFAAQLAATRANPLLPGVALAGAVTVSAQLGSVLAQADIVILAAPSHTVRELLSRAAPAWPGGATLVTAAKGIENDTLLTTGEVAAEVLGAQLEGRVVVLSGPSFADDVARGLPTAVTLACRDAALAEELATALSGPTLRVYHRQDVRGVEIGGAAKNVLAIACGAVAGKGLGESAKAALIARGFAELLRFARAYGGDAETLMGLSGLGDLVLTCSSAHSRNFAFGHRLGLGLSVEEAAGGKLVEGAATASALMTLARAKNVDMPIAEAVDQILSGAWNLDQAVDALMNRPIKSET